MIDFPASEELATAHPPTTSPSLKIRSLSAGTPLWRIHNECFEPTEFNPTIRRTPADGGGRFDSDDGSYSYLYAASDSVAAVAETLLRNPHPPAPYHIPYARIEGRRLSQISPTQDLQMVVLHGAGLSIAGLDSRITSCGPGLGLANYAVTRKWASAIRSWDETVVGLVWRPRHENDRFAYVFFEDRCRKGVIQPVPDRSYPLDERGKGYWLANSAAMKHGAVISLPSSPS